MWRLLLGILLLFTAFGQKQTDSLASLASDFWTWRAQYRPFTFDDVPRMDHTPGRRDWSAASIAKQHADLAAFERRWNAMQTDGWPVAQKVDYRLMGSPSRAWWELDVNPRWQRDPAFYVADHRCAPGSLVTPPPFSGARSREIVARTENIPSILEQAKLNLKAIAPFARLTIAILPISMLGWRAWSAACRRY